MRGRTFVTGDYHLNHEPIIMHCARPFNTAEEMDDCIINKHNKIVKKDDTVILNGDFFLRSKLNDKEAQDYVDKLNGNLVFIRGNHDRKNGVKTPIRSMVLSSGRFVLNIIHDPKHAVDSGYKFNLVAHIHNNWKYQIIRGKTRKDDIYLINIGVDVWNFAPVNVGRMEKYINKIIQRHKKDMSKLITITEEN